MSSRTAGLLIVGVLLAIVLSPRWLYGTRDTCAWLRTEAAGIAWREAGLAEDELPLSQDPRYDWWLERTAELVEPYHSEGRCLPGWVRLMAGRAPPVVR